jgi:hypothetical protein
VAASPAWAELKAPATALNANKKTGPEWAPKSWRSGLFVGTILVSGIRREDDEPAVDGEGIELKSGTLFMRRGIESWPHENGITVAVRTSTNPTNGILEFGVARWPSAQKASQTR